MTSTPLATATCVVSTPSMSEAVVVSASAPDVPTPSARSFSIPLIGCLSEESRRAVLEGEPDISSLLAKPHLINKFVNKMAGTGDRKRLKELSWGQLRLEDEIDLVRLVLRNAEEHARATAQEKKLQALAIALEASSRRLREVEGALETERSRPSLRLELEEERARRSAADASVLQLRAREEELIAAKSFAEHQRDLAQAGRHEAEVALAAAEEARATAEASWGAAAEALTTAEAYKDFASAELVSQKVALDIFRAAVEERENELERTKEEMERRMKEEVERLRAEHTAALSQARAERLEVLLQDEQTSVAVGAPYFRDGFEYCKEKIAQKFPELDLGDIQLGDDDEV